MKGLSLKWVAGGIAILVLAALVYAYAGHPGEDPRRPVFSSQWNLCETGDVCISVRAPCGEWEPVNAMHERDASAYYDHLMTVVEETGMECVSTNLSRRKPAAMCRTGTCVLGQ